MARKFGRQRSAHPIADLNVTNLIDLGFMLLVIFMIATPLMHQEEQKVAVDLPVESVKPQQEPDPDDRFETLTVKPDGTVLLNGRPFTIQQLAPELAKFAAQPKPPVVQLRCDAKATMQHIISVMDELQKHDLTRISFPTQVEK
jgi:biopolymer transport protein ExbD